VEGMPHLRRRAETTAATWAAIYLGVAGATLPSVMPIMVGVPTDKLGFGSVPAGRGPDALGSVS
jgi:hypothetical protein